MWVVWGGGGRHRARQNSRASLPSRFPQRRNGKSGEFHPLLHPRRSGPKLSCQWCRGSTRRVPARASADSSLTVTHAATLYDSNRQTSVPQTMNGVSIASSMTSNDSAKITVPAVAAPKYHRGGRSRRYRPSASTASRAAAGATRAIASKSPRPLNGAASRPAMAAARMAAPGVRVHRNASIGPTACTPATRA